MTRIYRICPACTREVELDAPRCPHCDCDVQVDYWPAPTTSALQKLKTALPAVLAVGVVTLQVGLALARRPGVQAMWQLVTRNRRKPNLDRVAQQPGRPILRIHSRTRWYVQGPAGRWERGRKESIVETR